MKNETFDALAKQDIALLGKILDSSSTLINQHDQFGYSLLHISISKSYDAISEFLILKGINPDLRDKNGKTALHYAAEYDKTEIAAMLLEKGADINIEDNYGNQPLWTAVFNDKGFGRRIELIKLFLKYNADINHLNNAGRSPLDMAVRINNTNVITLLNSGN